MPDIYQSLTEVIYNDFFKTLQDGLLGMVCLNFSKMKTVRAFNGGLDIIKIEKEGITYINAEVALKIFNLMADFLERDNDLFEEYETLENVALYSFIFVCLCISSDLYLKHFPR